MFRHIIYVLLFCFFIGTSGAQNLVTGIVKSSDDNQPVVAASIRVQNDPKKGTTTDLEGKFSLDATGINQIIISYIGYKQQVINITGKTFIEVTLDPETQELEGVVVTALGIERKEKTLGYSVQKVTGDILSNNNSPNFLNKLSGQVAGLYISPAATGPGGSSRILIRGSSSLTGKDEPLFVIDGVIVNNDNGNGATQDGGLDFGNAISYLNPDDILSISVLKGPSAAALYGSQGQNGAIIITTKKGNDTEKLGVAISSSASVEQPFIFPNFQNDFGRGSQGVYTPYNTFSYGPRYDGSSLVDWLGNEVMYEPVYNQMEKFFRNGLSVNNSLEISGGNPNAQTRLSFTQYKYNSIMPNSDIERYSGTFRQTAKLSKKVSLDAKINFVKQDAFNRPNLGGSPDNPVRNFYLMPRSVRLEDLDPYIDAAGLPILWDGRTQGTFNQNPYWSINLNTNSDVRNRVISSLMFNFEIFPWLKAQIRGGADYISDKRDSRIFENTPYKTSPVASYRYGLSNRFIGNYDFLFSANKKWSDFSINFSLGGSRLENISEGISSSGDDQVNPDLWVINNFKEVQTAQGISNKRINSIYQFADIGWKEKIFFSFTTRNDWSSALSPENWSFFYYSGNLSWIISSMWDTFPASIDLAKFRVSYASVGNDTNLGASSRYFTYSNSVGHLGQPFTRVPTVGPNPNILPEKTNSFETGIDFRMFQGLINLDLSYYITDTRDQIFTAPVAASSGFQSLLINAGVVRNQGLEVQIGGSPIRKGNFKWNFTLNASSNRPTIRELTQDIDLLILGGTRSGISVQGRVAQRNDLLVGTRFLKNADGQFIVDEFGLPQIEINEKGGSDFVLGHVQPSWLLGLNNRWSYRNFILNLNLDAQFGGSIYSSSYASGSSLGTLQNTIIARDAWNKSEEERKRLGYSTAEWIPTGGIKIDGVDENGILVSNYVNPQQYWGRLAGINEASIFDASFISISELALNYQVPKKLLSSFRIKTASVSLVGNNLGFLLRNTVGFSPQASFSSGRSQGIELYAFPSIRSIGFKINLQI